MKTISLDGLWRFTPDLEIRPENNHNLTAGPIYANPRLNRKDWEVCVVPGVWNRYAEVYRLYEGVMWFCREFELPALGSRTKVRLRCKGVTYRADVFMNAEPVGTHESGYTEFTMDVTQLVREGTNLLTLRVDNRAALRKWPCDRGYFGYGGIHRSVLLELLEPGDPEELELTPGYDPESGEGILTARGKTYEADRVTFELESFTAELRTDADGRFAGELRIPNVRPWSPEKPELQLLRVKTSTAECAFPIGFRSLSIGGGKVLLNGAPCSFKGVCYVYDSPVYGLAMPREQLEQDLGEMKAAGINAIRLHYPMSDLFYELCDSMGFFVWVEPNVYCYHPDNAAVGTFYTQPDYVENARQMIREMIAPARRHPCVTFYSIGNECNLEHAEAPAFFRDLAGLVKLLDPSRPIAFAALYGMVGSIADVIDVIGLNSYFGWYDRVTDLYQPGDGIPADGTPQPDLTPLHKMLREVLAKIPASTPVLLTEFGADSIPGFYSEAEELWSENYHARVIRDTIAASREYERIQGTFIFCFTDNLDPSKPRNGYWNWQNLKGLLSYNRDRKLSFYAARDSYED